MTFTNRYCGVLLKITVKKSKIYFSQPQPPQNDKGRFVDRVQVFKYINPPAHQPTT